MRESFNKKGLLFLSGEKIEKVANIDDLDKAEAEKRPFLGIDLGFDFCAEHEFGVAGIKRLLGISEEITGRGFLDRLQTKSVNPENMTYQELDIKPRDKRRKKQRVHRLLVARHQHTLFDKKTPRFMAEAEDRWYTPVQDDLLCQWNSDGFDIAARYRVAPYVTQMAEALANQDLALGGEAVQSFVRSNGLVFVIGSAIPDAFKERILEADLDELKLRKAVEATGIHKKLEKAKKGYFALSPRWMPEKGNLKKPSKYNLLFWLNPTNQKKNHSGWYTVEDLEAWIEEEGPVVNQ